MGELESAVRPRSEGEDKSDELDVKDESEAMRRRTLEVGHELQQQ